MSTDFLSSLEKDAAKRIFDKIMIAKTNPYHFFERLSGRKEFKLRVGDHRVIADIEQNVIWIRLIGHRKNVYEK